MRRLTLLFLAAVLAAIPAAAEDYLLVYVGPGSSSALQGVRLGVDESNLQGAFLGVTLSLREAETGQELPTGAVAVLADSRGSIPDLARTLENLPLLNLSDGSDALRTACLDTVLHVIPSDHMKADAVGQWRGQHPDAPVAAAAWHPDAVKFAARDLNKRYRERFGEPMDDLAWSGWFAARAVGDTLMRERSESPSALLRDLKAAEGLDGQKGDPQSFRASGQLRQGLVLVDPDGKLLGEAPVRGAQGGLDSLGVSPCE